MIGAAKSTSVVIENVHCAGYRRNSFLHNQVSHLSTSSAHIRNRIGSAHAGIKSKRDQSSLSCHTAVVLSVKRTVAIDNVSGSHSLALKPLDSMYPAGEISPLFSYVTFAHSFPLSFSLFSLFSLCPFCQRIISFRRCDP